jgi:glycosyl hydrolase family 16
MRTRTAVSIAAACLLLTGLPAASSEAAPPTTPTASSTAAAPRHPNPTAPRPMSRVAEEWAAPSPTFTAATPSTTLSVVADQKARDGRALRLRLPGGAAPGPMQGVGVRSRDTYLYGTFSTRMRAADCGPQTDAGVVTGAFTYANDGLDHDGDGIPDNDEIDIEFLCAQPEVVYLTIWTDYSETTDAFTAITRTIDLSSGTVLSTCRRHNWADGCEQKNRVQKIRKIKNYNATTTFRTYGFDWQPGHVTYFTFDDAGRRLVLWDYRGDVVPDTAAPFMQNVWHSANWDPIGRRAHEATMSSVSAYVDSTTISAGAGT